MKGGALFCSPRLGFAITLIFGSSALAGGAANYYQKSYQLEKLQKFSQAFSVASQLVKVENSYDSWLRYGWLGWLSKNFSEASKGYRRALRFSPHSMDAGLGLIASLDAEKKWSASVLEARRFLADSPKHTGCLRYLAHGLYMQGMYGEAEDVYRSIVRVAPKDGEMVLGLALSKLRLGKTEESGLVLDQAEALLPGDSRILAARRELASDWKVKVGIYGFTGGYSGSPNYNSFDGYQMLLEAKLVDGLYLLGDYSANNVPVQGNSELDKGRRGIGFVKTDENSRFLLHWAKLSGAAFALGDGDVWSAYLGKGNKGISLDLGSYQNFNTKQVAGFFSRNLDSTSTLTWSPMIQRRSGSFLDARGDSKALMSVSLSYAKTVGENLFLAKAYGGRRWFTAENSGMLIWNADEEFSLGAEITVTMKQFKKISPILGLRYDRLTKISGVDNSGNVLTFTFGADLKF
jgi:tetratricopeptide (TPR) repeat protein